MQNLLAVGESIKCAMGYEWSVKEINENGILLDSNRAFSYISEKGTISLSSKETQLKLDEGEPKTIAVPIMDASFRFTITVENIMDL